MQFQSVTKRGSNGQPDVISVPGILADWMDRNPEWERIPEPTPPAEELKGAELDEALEEAGLPKSGKADEKRARLADHSQKEQ